MRETRIAQASIFEKYSDHQHGAMLQKLSQRLDEHPQILDLVATDLIDTLTAPAGRIGLSVESVLRCLLLKQLLRVSYEQLAFHLSDSMTYCAFTRLNHQMPSRSGLQSTIRRIGPETLEQADTQLTGSGRDLSERTAYW